MTILISSKKDGFRRCGRAFSKRPTAFSDGVFTDDELAVLKAEPMLAVTVMEDEIKTPPLSDMTVRELKDLCDKLEIEYAANAKKADLVDLIEKNTAKPPEE